MDTHFIECLCHNLICSSDGHYNDKWLNKRFGQLLWGYPDLVTKFYKDVYPVLREVREERSERQKIAGKAANPELERTDESVNSQTRPGPSQSRSQIRFALNEQDTYTLDSDRHSVR